MALAVVAIACHPLFGHIDGIESVEDKENICVDWAVTEQPPPTGIDFASARSIIQGILEDDTQGWESVSPKVNFVVAAAECDALTKNDRAEQEIEFRIGNFLGLDYGPCSGPCLEFDETTAVTHNDWVDFTKAKVYLIYPDLRDNSPALRTSIVNHETGHAIGFDDPIELLVGACIGQPCCSVDYEGHIVWNVSIMHNKPWCDFWLPVEGSVTQAENLAWPSVFDKEFAEFFTEKP